jgi:hypothetical protein
MESTKAEQVDAQKVRLWLNQITKENQEKKSGELREMLLGRVKLLGEEGFDPVEAEKLEIN